MRFSKRMIVLKYYLYCHIMGHTIGCEKNIEKMKRCAKVSWNSINELEKREINNQLEREIWMLY